jgi:Transposase IS116/IS110/IS902 family
VSSGQRKVHRLSRRGNRRLNHAIHMAAITQVSHRHSQGRAYYDKKLAEGKTPKEALRALKRQVSNAIFACLQADARRAAARSGDPGGQQGNGSVASAADLHPRHRLFGQATPGPSHHPTTPAGSPAPGHSRNRKTTDRTPRRKEAFVLHDLVAFVETRPHSADAVNLCAGPPCRPPTSAAPQP